MIVVFSIIYFVITKPFKTKKFRLEEMDAVSRYLICIAFVVIVFSFYAVDTVLTDFNRTNQSAHDWYKTSASFAGVLSGIMTPFIGIATAIVAGLAFYMQYKANQQIRSQFKLQQFESQFYEMLKLHRENLNEMEIEGYDYTKKLASSDCSSIYKVVVKEDAKESSYEDQDLKKKSIKGRKLFYLMLKEFEALFLIIKRYDCLERGDGYTVDSDMRIVVNDGEKYKLLSLAYHIFFSGKEIYSKQIKRIPNDVKFLKLFNYDTLRSILKEIDVLRTCHKKGVRYLENYIQGKGVKQSLHLDFSYRPFGGHQIRLGHYYRHMIALVKHVVEQPDDLLSYEAKRKYLKIFRAQLSNYEVVLLYYNWLGGAGSSWEEKLFEPLSKRRNDKNKFFTDYRILHNINKDLVLSEFDPVELFSQHGFENFEYKKGKREEDSLFELYEIKSRMIS